MGGGGRSASRRRRRGAWLWGLASGLAHLVLLALVGLDLAHPTWPSADRSRPLSATLIRLGHRRPEVAHPARAAARAPRTGRAGPTGPAALAQEPAASPTAVMAGSPAAGSSEARPPGQAAGAEPYEDGGQGVRAMLRAMAGCRQTGMAIPTEAEKTRCNHDLVETARNAKPFSGVPPEKRAYYDAVQQRYEALRDPRAYGAPRINVSGAAAIRRVPAFLVPLPGCGMKFGPGAGKKDKRSLRDRIQDDGFASVDIGPLKCGIAIPTGSLTPDVGIPQP